MNLKGRNFLTLKDFTPRRLQPAGSGGRTEG